MAASLDSAQGLDESPMILLRNAATLDKCDDFISFLDIPGNSNQGFDGNMRLTRYICHEKLEEYWTTERILEILDLAQIKATSARDIQKDCLQMFSTLCYCLAPEYIVAFRRSFKDDGELPLRSEMAPGSWATNDLRKKIYTDFRREQWQFAPYIFDLRHTISWLDHPRERIIPMDRGDTLSDGDEATVYKLHFTRNATTYRILTLYSRSLREMQG